MKILARFLAVSVLAVGSVAVLSGCCKKSGSSSSTGGGSTGSTVAMSNAKVQFDAPGGWGKVPHSNGWTQYLAPDKYASLAFVTFDKPGESTSRIGQMAAVLGIDSVQWGGSQTSANLGRGGFPSKIGEGTCKIGGGDPCYVWYATVNPGTSTQVLIVYAVNTKVGSHHKANAKASVDSLRQL